MEGKGWIWPGRDSISEECTATVGQTLLVASPFFLETPHFSKVSGVQVLGSAFLQRATTALQRRLVSLWPINIKVERVSMKHYSPNQRSFILHLLLYVVSESLILRRGCGYALFVFFLFPSLSFFLSSLLRINFRETRANVFQWHASCHFSIRVGGVYLQDAVLSSIHCNKCHCKAGEAELAFINILNSGAHQEVDKVPPGPSTSQTTGGQCQECLQCVSIFVTPMCGHPSGLNQSVSSRSFAVLPAEIIHFFSKSCASRRVTTHHSPDKAY